MTPSDKIIPFDRLRQWRDGLRKENRRLVVTNGVFDLMHRGHAEYLAQAAALGDALLVLVNDDASVTALKGPSRPILPQEDRAFLLAALECVSAVSVFPGPQATEALRRSAPDLYVKGGDYTPETLNRDEFQALQACGSQIRILPLVPGCSTSSLVARIREEGRTPGDGAATARELDKRLQPIFRRRSIRAFLPREVEQREIGLLLEAAMAAPSAQACYPAHFLVLTDPREREAVSRVLPHGAFLAKAPLGILLCGDLEKSCHKALSYLVQDCSAAMENLLLAASMLGLGACWLGVHPNEDRVKALREHFQLPENILPIAAAALGWPGETKPPRTNYQPEQVHVNLW